MPFNFADNKKLRESGFALEGVTVNGFVNENGVTVNVNSAKALNSVVGHEITHVLEGTELYDALAQTITEYAKGKGDYDARLENLTKLYEGKEGYTGEDAQAKIEQEVVADLVGDYLFTDKDFVSRLSAENRNVFQKIYDEVKYLCRVATAGSKEARQLEKVRKIFEDAYRAETKNPTGEGGLKYSLLVKDTRGNVTSVNPAKTTREQMREYLVMSRKGQLEQYTYFPISSNTPITVISTLRNAGVNITDKPLAMQAKKARQSQNEGQHIERDGTIIRHHALNPEEIQEVIDKLNDPIAAIHQQDRVKRKVEDGKVIYIPAPDNFVFFVTLDSGKECVAVIEFDSYIDETSIEKDGYGDDYHTTVTVFEPDRYRDGGEFDYIEYLAVQPSNRELEIIKESPKTETAISQTQATVSEKELSNNSIRNPGEDVNSKFSLSSAENVKAAEQHFGITYKISEAGYLLTDGRLLDFSGRHEGGPGGYRTVDHRDITDALGDDYGDDTYSGGMIRFMGEGNIRLSPESGGINLSVKPNKAQLSALDRYITNFRGEVILDIDDENGNTVVSVEYPKRTYSKRIINDINAYFDNGTIPEPPSSIGQFLSLSEQKKQEQTDSPFPLPWQVRGEDVAFPLPEGYQEQSQAVTDGAQEAVSEEAAAQNNEDGDTPITTVKERLEAKQKCDCLGFCRNLSYTPTRREVGKAIEVVEDHLERVRRAPAENK